MPFPNLHPLALLPHGRGTLVGPFFGALLVGGLSFWLGGGVIGGQTTLIMGFGLIAEALDDLSGFEAAIPVVPHKAVEISDGHWLARPFACNVVRLTTERRREQPRCSADQATVDEQHQHALAGTSPATAWKPCFANFRRCG